MTTDVSVIIPWRDSGDRNRQANLAAVLDWLAPFDVPLILASDGRPQGQPFNRSAAYNEGMRLSPSEVYVFHEADMLIPFHQLHIGVEMAQQGLGLVVPFTQYRYLSEENSREVIGGLAPQFAVPQWTMEHGRSIGAVNILSAESMRWVGQWDEALEGHGYDDNVMHEAFETSCGPTRYVDGPGNHLWHPMAYAPWERGTEAADPANFTVEEVEATRRNRERYALYRAATTPEQVRELTGAPW